MSATLQFDISREDVLSGGDILDVRCGEGMEEEIALWENLCNNLEPSAV